MPFIYFAYSKFTICFTQSRSSDATPYLISVMTKPQIPLGNLTAISCPELGLPLEEKTHYVGCVAQW